MDIEIYTTDETRARAASALSELAGEAVKRPVLLLLSGGSALSVLPFVVLPRECARLTLSTLDERFSRASSENNFLLLRETALFGRAKEAGASFIDTSVREGDTLASFAARTDAALKEWAARHPDGVVYALVGVGHDGHVAGVMPYPEDSARFRELFERAEAWVVGYDAEAKNPLPLRATPTLPFLRTRVDASVVYAIGEEKHGALERLRARAGTLSETPARVLLEMKRVRLFSDIEV